MRTDKFLKLAFTDNDLPVKLPKKVASASILSLTITQIWKYIAEPNGIDVVAAVAAIVERRCRICGCVQDQCDKCVEKTGDACHWVEDDLCSSCVSAKKYSARTSRSVAGSPTRSSTRRKKPIRKRKSRLNLLVDKS